MSYDPAARRKTPLALVLADEIRRNGPMPVREYMARCLWDEQHGYYATRLPLGQAGDFITAPEISQTFGELIGLWAAVVWRDLMGAPATHTLAELGPGRGTLMRDVLRATAKVAGFQTGMRCHLVEASAPLIAQQRAALEPSGVPVTWSGALDGVAGPAVLLANEFFDALPVTQWIMTNGRYEERSVVLNGAGDLAFGDGSAVAPDVAELRASVGGAKVSLEQKTPDGSIWEIIPKTELVESLAAMADAAPLAMLVIDYGHEKSAFGDTLQAVRNHAHEHPLTSPGEADLSAQVDFDALGGAATGCGLVVDGPITQAEFLGRLGIVERARRLMTANPARAAEIESGVARLMAPDGMGTRFKVMGLRSRSLPNLPGFDAVIEENKHR